MRKGLLLAASGLLALSIAVSGFDGLQTDTAYIDTNRDIFTEHATAQAAVTGVDAPLNPRTPAAALTSIWLVATPGNYLVWTTVFVNIAAVVVLVAGLFQFTADPTARVVAAVAVPLSVMFVETLGFANTWVVYAAALVWAWWHIEQGHDIAGGVLAGLAGAVRLWPLALVALFVIWKRWRLTTTTVVTVAVLNLAGLLLPGVTITGSIQSLTKGADHWVGSPYNGSLAGILEGYVAQPALVGFLTAAAVWLAVLPRTKGVRHQVGWTLTAAMFASPLMWVGYMLVVTPLLVNRKWMWLATPFFFPSPVVMWTVGLLITGLMFFNGDLERNTPTVETDLFANK